MQERILRTARAEDLDDICRVWSLSFGDEEALVRQLMTADALLEHTVVAVRDGKVCSAMAAFDGLSFHGEDVSYLYALCTHPDERGHGHGAAVVREAAVQALRRGAKAAVLSPASPSLARWYASLGFVPGPAWVEKEVSPPWNETASVQPLSASVYAGQREGCAIGLSAQLLAVQERFCSLSGGGFYAVVFPHDTALACVEPQDGHLRIRELLCAETLRPAAIGALLRCYSMNSAVLLCPDDGSGAATPHLMALPSDIHAGFFPDTPFPFVLD